MSICIRFAGVVSFASLVVFSGPGAYGAEIPGWMRGELINRCRSDAPQGLSPKEANRFCRCLVDELAEELTDDDFVEMSKGTMSKALAGQMMQFAGRCLQEN